MKPFSLTLLLFFTLASCASAHQAGSASSGRETNMSSKTGSTAKTKKVRSEAGLNIPSWGVAIDAVYDKRLDHLIPGYKIINVVLTNRSPGTIYLDPGKDAWIIRDNVGKNHRAINHLRFASEKLWLALPVGLKDQLEYPHAVRTGNSTKIDLFFSAGTELTGFREISWRSDHFKQVFDVYTALEKNLDWDPKSEKIPTETPAVRQSLEKYEGELKNAPPATPTKSIEQSPPPFDPRLDETTTIPMD